MLSKSFNSKRVFKEKIVQLYIAIIKKEEPCNSNQNFWDEFFLLKANGNALELELKKLENVTEIKAVTNLLFSRCLIAIRDTNQLRVLNGLITLCSLSHFVLHGLKSNLSSELLIDILIGKDDFIHTFEAFVECICDLLFSYVDNGIKGIVLKLLLIFTTAELDVNKNHFIDYLMSDQIFEALINLLNSHQQDGCKILLLLIIFLNYKKSSINNPYVMKLSIVDNEVLLSEYSQVISNELVDFNQKFDRICTDSRSGIFSTLSNMVGTIFSSDDNSVDISAVMGKKASFHTIKTVLLAFYEAVLLNRNFISLLTTSLPGMSSLKKDDQMSTDSGYLSNCLPPNLLVAFLEFTSIIMLDMKDENTLQTTKLCFIVLTCITEDSCANSIIHDNNMAFIVNLQRMPMRHRKVSNAKSKGIRPLSHVILDLMTEFILSHMNRNIQYDLFLLCLGIILRLLSFQKRCRVRIDYSWKELWSALTSLIKFFIGNESYFVKHQLDMFTLCQHIINLFNLFIMCGDNFLATTNYYDELYYEIIRTYSVFDNLNSLALRHMTKESNGFKESATKLTHSLINVKAIIAHFNAKIEAYSSQNQIVTLSEDQVLEVVRNNYDSLTLKIQDNIDQFEPYDPAKTSEFEFLMKLLASIVEDYTSSRPLTVGLEEQYLLVQNIQTNSAINSMQACASQDNHSAVACAETP